MPIDIYVSFTGPHSAKDHIMRTPAEVPDVYLKDYFVTFDAFSSACTLELVDTETNETVYNQVIPAGSTSCLLPSTLKGRYLMRFVFENVVYWGYILICKSEYNTVDLLYPDQTGQKERKPKSL